MWDPKHKTHNEYTYTNMLLHFLTVSLVQKALRIDQLINPKHLACASD